MSEISETKIPDDVEATPEEEKLHTGGKYGTGFFVRMGVLLLLLAAVAYGMYYDRAVLAPKADRTINDVYALITLETDDGHGIPKDKVQETVGFKASEEFSEGDYDVEKYEFKRALPFAPGQFINVVYQNGALVKVLHNQEFDLESMADAQIKHAPPEDEREMPSAAMAGGPPPQLNTGDDDDGESDDGDGDGDESNSDESSGDQDDDSGEGNDDETGESDDDGADDKDDA